METESATTFVGCPMQNKNVEPQQDMAKIVSPSEIPASQLAVNEKPPPPPPRDCKLLACRTWARSHHWIARHTGQGAASLFRDGRFAPPQDVTTQDTHSALTFSASALLIYRRRRVRWNTGLPCWPTPSPHQVEGGCGNQTGMGRWGWRPEETPGAGSCLLSTWAREGRRWELSAEHLSQGGKALEGPCMG